MSIALLFFSNQDPMENHTAICCYVIKLKSNPYLWELRQSRQESAPNVKTFSLLTKRKCFKTYFLRSQRLMGNVVLNVMGSHLRPLGIGFQSSLCACARPARLLPSDLSSLKGTRSPGLWVRAEAKVAHWR